MLSHLKFAKIDAQILNVEKIRTSELEISGGDRGRVDSFGSITLNPIKAETIHTTSMDIYVRDSNGNEDFYKLVDVDIPLREGHKVTMITAQSKFTKPQVIYIQNHTLRDSDLTMNTFAQIAFVSGSVVIQLFLSAVLVVAGLYIAGEIADGFLTFGFVFVLSSLPLGYFLSKYTKSFKIKAQSLLDHNDY